MTDKDELIEAQRKHISDLRSIIRTLESALEKANKAKR